MQNSNPICEFKLTFYHTCVQNFVQNEIENEIILLQFSTLVLICILKTYKLE